MTETSGASWLLVKDDITARISAGEYPVGSAIPSHSKLMEQHRVSDTVIKQAVSALKTLGVLRGQPGKAVYVQAMPKRSDREQVEADRAELARLSEGLAELQQQVTELRERVGRMRATDARAVRKPPGGKRGQDKAATGNEG